MSEQRRADMARVELWGSLRAAADGRAVVEVEASTIRELLDRLGEAYPALRPQLERGVSVSVDRRLYRNAWLQPITPESEVVLLPRLKGG